MLTPEIRPVTFTMLTDLVQIMDPLHEVKLKELPEKEFFHLVGKFIIKNPEPNRGTLAFGWMKKV